MISGYNANSENQNVSWTRESTFGRWFQNSNTWFRYVLEAAVDDFHELLGNHPAPETLLDLGCGHGLSFKLIKEQIKPKRIVAIDIDEAMLRTAHARARELDGEIVVKQGNAARIDAADGSFDMVVCHQLLHHVDDQAAVLAEMYRVLKPGGVVLIGETCKVFIEMIPIRVLFTHPKHSQLTADEYVALVRSAGFNVSENQLKRYTPWWSVLDLGLIDRLGWRKRPREVTEVMMIGHKP